MVDRARGEGSLIYGIVDNNFLSNKGPISVETTLLTPFIAKNFSEKNQL